LANWLDFSAFDEVTMYVIHKNDVRPHVQEHGEIIYELIGRSVDTPTEQHSVAYVVIPPSKSSIRHYHPVAEESHYILHGRALMELGEEKQLLEPGQIVLIPRGLRHEIHSEGPEDLEFLAISAPAWEEKEPLYQELDQ
jgi:mannose-6-phosphate isomerase-like protein (cupin superfamily)